MLYESPCDEPGYFDCEYGDQCSNENYDPQAILENRRDYEEAMAEY